MSKRLNSRFSFGWKSDSKEGKKNFPFAFTSFISFSSDFSFFLLRIYLWEWELHNPVRPFFSTATFGCSMQHLDFSSKREPKLEPKGERESQVRNFSSVYFFPRISYVKLFFRNCNLCQVGFGYENVMRAFDQNSCTRCEPTLVLVALLFTSEIKEKCISKGIFFSPFLSLRLVLLK